MSHTATPLQSVAAAMQKTAQAAPNRHAFRVLKHGLAIVYGQRDGRTRLAIGRQAPSQPSHQEMEIVAKAFHAPFDFAPICRQATWWDDLENRTRTYNVLEITWREREPAPGLVEGVAAPEVAHAH